MTKYLAMIVCVAGVTLLAGAGANACGNGSEELLASPVSLESETSAAQSAPKDKSPAQQGGK